jgi:hypothetical protein
MLEFLRKIVPTFVKKQEGRLYSREMTLVGV